MPFEYFNPHTCRQGCHLGSEFGEVKVEPGQHVPTPAQEAKGITPKMFEPHVGKSFLHKTPGDVRRRLRAEHAEELHAQQQTRTAEAAARDRAAARIPAAVAAASTPGAQVAESGSGEDDGGGASSPPAAPAAPVAPEPPRVPVPPTGGPRRPEEQLGGRPQKTANDLQSLADQSCSSAGKKEGKQLR